MHKGSPIAEDDAVNKVLLWRIVDSQQRLHLFAGSPENSESDAKRAYHQLRDRGLTALAVEGTEELSHRRLQVEIDAAEWPSRKKPRPNAKQTFQNARTGQLIYIGLSHAGILEHMRFRALEQTTLPRVTISGLLST